MATRMQVVGNLRQVQPDHAARIARFALDAVQTANNIDVHEDDPSMGRLSIRAGFHSGEVCVTLLPGQVVPSLAKKSCQHFFCFSF